MITLDIDIEKSLEKMDQASEAKFLASRKDFLTLDSTSLANRNQEINFGRGKVLFCCAFAYCLMCTLLRLLYSPTNFCAHRLSPPVRDP